MKTEPSSFAIALKALREAQVVKGRPLLKGEVSDVLHGLTGTRFSRGTVPDGILETLIGWRYVVVEQFLNRDNFIIK